jgi:hypothetical protein
VSCRNCDATNSLRDFWQNEAKMINVFKARPFFRVSLCPSSTPMESNSRSEAEALLAGHGTRRCLAMTQSPPVFVLNQGLSTHTKTHPSSSYGSPSCRMFRRFSDGVATSQSNDRPDRFKMNPSPLGRVQGKTGNVRPTVAAAPAPAVGSRPQCGDRRAAAP